MFLLQYLLSQHWWVTVLSTSLAFYLSNSTWFHSGSRSTEAIAALSLSYFYWRAETERQQKRHKENTHTHKETLNEEAVISKIV